MADYGADQWRWEHGVMKGHEDEATPTIEGVFQVVRAQLISDHGRAALDHIEAVVRARAAVQDSVKDIMAERDALKVKLAQTKEFLTKWRVLAEDSYSYETHQAVLKERDALIEKFDQMQQERDSFGHQNAVLRGERDALKAEKLANFEAWQGEIREVERLRAALESAPPATVLSSPLYSKWYTRSRQALAQLEEK